MTIARQKTIFTVYIVQNFAEIFSPFHLKHLHQMLKLWTAKKTEKLAKNKV